jgi:electron-transferring-flavoprotein dehydrogenase
VHLMNSEANVERESIKVDVVIIGAGPSGLSAAIRLMQLAAKAKRELNVCIVEKGSEVGAHILSGAVIETRALDELVPDWKEKKAPLNTQVTHEKMMFLSKNGALKIPSLFLPPAMHNNGNYIISLGNFCRWLGEQAEAMGVEIYPGFAAAEILYNEDGSVKGIATGDMGVGKNHAPGPNYQQGMEIHAKYTFFAEGCRGHLGKQLKEKFNLEQNIQSQTYGIGIKELWEVDPAKHKKGEVTHTAGWPLSNDTYGGSFIYHLDHNQVAIGFVVGLDYKNPYLSPYEEFQRFKTHPAIKPMLEGGRRISYGARALNEGGLQCLPKLDFPGGVLIGCDAGTLNMPKIKGTHTAMKSGMLAAESTFKAIVEGRTHDELADYGKAFLSSWAGKELHSARNVRPSFKWGFLLGTIYTGLDQIFLRGKAPWTIKFHGADHTKLKKANECRPIDYPKPDGKITFDRLTNVSFSGTNHEEDQPNHLTLDDNNTPVNVNLADYDGPEARYCPAGVYEYVKENNVQRLQINSQNCVHCKTCDIKDPTQNIKWVTPEGGGGPNYPNM